LNTPEGEHEQHAGDEHAEHPQERADAVRDGASVLRRFVLIDVTTDVRLMELDAARDPCSRGQRWLTLAVHDEFAVDPGVRPMSTSSAWTSASPCTTPSMRTLAPEACR